MREFLLRIEPLIWLLFGQGLLFGTMLLTGWILIVGIAAPLGWVAPEALAFDRVHALASNPVGRLVLAALIVLPLWKGVHHMREYMLLARDGIEGEGGRKIKKCTGRDQHRHQIAEHLPPDTHLVTTFDAPMDVIDFLLEHAPKGVDIEGW